MMTRRLLLAATAALLLGGTDVRAEGLQGRFSLAVQAGTDSELGGHILSGASADFLGTTVTVATQKYRSVYKPDFLARVQAGYGVSKKSEILVRGSYYKAKATGIQAGTAGENPVYAFIDPYTEWGVEAAWHFYFATEPRLKSYIGPVAGARFIDAILCKFSIPTLGAEIANVPLYGAGTVPVFGLDIGFSFDLSHTVFLGVETGVRYQTKLPAPSRPTLAAPFTQDADRWSAPVTATLGLRF
jgi:hypothetical protein